MKLHLLGPWLPLIRRLPPAVRAVALSYDDGPAPETTPDLLALLRDHEARATFFVSGVRAARHPELVEAMVADGHMVYGHGWEHIRLDHAGRTRLITDMTRVETLLSRIRPTPSPYLVRLPYAGGYRNPAVHRALRAWMPQAQIAHWSCHFGDPKLAAVCRTRTDVEELARAPIAAVLNDPALIGSVVLLHEMAFDVDSPFRRDVTLHLTQEFLKGLKAQNLTCRPIEPLTKPSPLSRYLLN
jgi:peptidoglycan/xylan/chitin deacetylase (PgdA/CDA1 family)